MENELLLLVVIIGKSAIFDHIFYDTFLTVHFSLRIWKQNDGKYELERNVQGEHERNIYSVNWSERGILTGSGDNKIRLFVEQSDQTWLCTKTIELKADINSGWKNFYVIINNT